MTRMDWDRESRLKRLHRRSQQAGEGDDVPQNDYSEDLLWTINRLNEFWAVAYEQLLNEMYRVTYEDDPSASNLEEQLEQLCDAINVLTDELWELVRKGPNAALAHSQVITKMIDEGGFSSSLVESWPSVWAAISLLLDPPGTNRQLDKDLDARARDVSKS